MSYYGAHLDTGGVPQPRQYTLTKEDKAQLQAQAIDGVIPIRAHIGTIFEILNRNAPAAVTAETHEKPKPLQSYHDFTTSGAAMSIERNLI